MQCFKEIFTLRNTRYSLKETRNNRENDLLNTDLAENVKIFINLKICQVNVGGG